MKVSVAMITYNHERFIAQAIESVLMQETSFDYELVIGEDCSTDRTREIVVDLQERFPQKIRLLLPESNLGMHENFSRTLAFCRGRYVALLEGDDFWTSPHKLQMQVGFLDSHPECSFCFHPVKWIYDDEQAAPPGWHNSVWPPRYRECSTVEDILREMFIQTASVVFRMEALDEYPTWLYQLPIGDWPLFILLADKGKIGCLKEVMSVYRRHAESVWFAVTGEKQHQSVIKMYECLNTHFENKYADIIRPILADYYLKLGVLYDQRGSYDMARPAVAKSVGAQLSDKRIPSLRSLKMLARLCFPSLYNFTKRIIKA